MVKDFSFFHIPSDLTFDLQSNRIICEELQLWAIGTDADFQVLAEMDTIVWQEQFMRLKWYLYNFEVVLSWDANLEQIKVTNAIKHLQPYNVGGFAKIFDKEDNLVYSDAFEICNTLFSYYKLQGKGNEVESFKPSWFDPKHYPTLPEGCYMMLLVGLPD